MKILTNKKYKLALVALIIAALVSIDQSAKISMQRSLTKKTLAGYSGTRNAPFRIAVINSNFMVIKYRENQAAAFSFMKSVSKKYRMKILIFLNIASMTIFIMLFLSKKKANIFTDFSFCLIMSGAIGNFLNRITAGCVIDFIDIYLNISSKTWPTFNFADIFITLGTINLALTVLIPKNTRGKNCI